MKSQQWALVFFSLVRGKLLYVQKKLQSFNYSNGETVLKYFLAQLTITIPDDFFFTFSKQSVSLL